MKLKGSITVFLSLIMVCVAALVCGLLESARTAGIRYYARTASDSAMDSLFSEYHNKLWDGYRLIMLECPDEDTAATHLKDYMKPYLEAGNWYAMTDPQIEMERMQYATDGGGEWFEQDLLDYMHYAVTELDYTPSSAEDLWKDVKEAGSMEKITSAYGGHSREAIAMEKTIMAIADNLTDQHKLKEKALDALADGDNSDFQKKAKELIEKIDKLPELIQDYETKADAFGTHLSETENSMALEWEKLSDATAEALRKDIDAYRSYTDNDGPRRTEIVSLDDNNSFNKDIIDRARELADEVEDTISSADEEDDIDEDELWEEVMDLFDEVSITDITHSYGIEDEDTEECIEKAMAYLSGDLLALVIPMGRSISDGEIDLNNMPSHTAVSSRTTDELSLLDNLMMEEYAGRFFTNFTDNMGKPVDYEMEYIIGGLHTDRMNLSVAVSEILAIREGLNYMHIMLDDTKRSEAEALGAAIAGLAEAPQLEKMISYMIIGTWALGESVIDVRDLLDGKKVPLYKTKDDWKLSLEGLKNIGEDQVISEEDDATGTDSGVDYETYLKFLIFTKSSQDKNYRMMDLIQLNMRAVDEDFDMRHAVYGMKIKTTCSVKHLFTSLSISQGSFFDMDNSWDVITESVKAY